MSIYTKNKEILRFNYTTKIWIKFFSFFEQNNPFGFERQIISLFILVDCVGINLKVQYNSNCIV